MIDYWNSGHIKIANISSANEYDSVSSDTNLVLCDEPLPDSFTYPTKVSFTLKVPASMETYLQSFPSSKRSSILKRQRDTNSHFEIVIASPFTKDQFAEWLAGYLNFMASLPHGSAKLNSEWYETGHQNHFGVFIYDKATTKMAGGLLVKVFGSERLSISYAWYNEEARKVGASTAAFLIILEHCLHHKFDQVSFGQDTNLFGGHLSLGLHEYKIGWHAEPGVPKAAETKYLKVKQALLPEQKALFYTLENDSLAVVNLP